MIKDYYIITGANGSIGRAITEALAAQGLPIIMACRNIAKAEPIKQQIIDTTGNSDIRLLPLDLASVQSIKRFSQQLCDEGISIKALVNNAGVMCKEFGQTADGLERTVGVNYLGTILLTHLLLPLMHRGSRIVMTTSLTRYIGKIDTTFFTDTPQNYKRFKAYSKSKLGLTLYSARLAEELRKRGITVNAADPGVVDSDMITMHSAWIDPLANLFFRPFISTPQQGATGAIYATTSPEAEGVTGEIFRQKGHKPIPQKWINKVQTAELLQETSSIILKFIHKE